MSNTPVNRHLISSVITGGSHTSADLKNAQNAKALVGAIVATGEGVMTFMDHEDKGPEAKALTDSMISVADQIKNE